MSGTSKRDNKVSVSSLLSELAARNTKLAKQPKKALKPKYSTTEKKKTENNLIANVYVTFVKT